MRTIVFGASGFVGSAYVERLMRSGQDCVAVIHSAGNAWRLARHGTNLAIVDVTSRAAVAAAMRGCERVVNCTRGDDAVMMAGLKNLLTEAKAQGVRRFVHLSSVAVYGDPPPRESEREVCEAKPEAGSYGELKLRQDEMVERAHAEGLSCAILCPPNITGLYSTFVTNVLDDMRSGSLALVDGGRWPVNTVDVENLCHAIDLAFAAARTDGKRMFVTDGEALTWGAFTDALLPLAECAPLPSVRAADVPQPRQTDAARSSVWRAMKHIVSSDVRAALRKDPLLAKLDGGVRGLVAKLPRASEDSLRYSIEGPRKLVKVARSERFTSRYVTQQLRGVVHGIDRATRELGYAPAIDVGESVARFRRWYAATRGVGGPSWPLVKELLA